MEVYLNSQGFLYENLHVSFDETRFVLLYYIHSKILSTYCGENPFPLLDPSELKNIAPVNVID